MRRLILVICFISAFVLGARVAVCQCKCAFVPGSKYLSAYEALKTADVVFIGEVVKVKQVSIPPMYRGALPYEYEVTFKVKRAWKKEMKERTALRTIAEGCIISFEQGEEFLVYAQVRDKMVRTGACTRTNRLAKAAEDLKDFEENDEQPQKIIKTLSPKP